MLNMVLLDCAINEKCCSVDGGLGICPLFSSPPRGIWQLKSSHPREFAIQDKKRLMPRGQPGGGRGGAGRSWNWLMHYFRIILNLRGNMSIVCVVVLSELNENKPISPLPRVPSKMKKSVDKGTQLSCYHHMIATDRFQLFSYWLWDHLEGLCGITRQHTLWESTNTKVPIF